MFLDQSSYMLNGLSKEAGAKVVVHGPGFPPLPDEFGIDIRPNTAAKNGIQKVHLVGA